MTGHDVAGVLPDGSLVRDVGWSTAMVEAVLLHPDGERYYSFSGSWPEAEELA